MRVRLRISRVELRYDLEWNCQLGLFRFLDQLVSSREHSEIVKLHGAFLLRSWEFGALVVVVTEVRLELDQPGPILTRSGSYDLFYFFEK